MPTAAHPDAELIRLGNLLDRAVIAENREWERAGGPEDDPEADAAYGRAEALGLETIAIVYAIEKHRALTLPGLLTKIRAIEYCCGSDQITELVTANALRPREPGDYTTDVRLMVGMLEDVRALAGLTRDMSSTRTASADRRPGA